MRYFIFKEAVIDSEDITVEQFDYGNVIPIGTTALVQVYERQVEEEWVTPKAIWEKYFQDHDPEVGNYHIFSGKEMVSSAFKVEADKRWEQEQWKI